MRKYLIVVIVLLVGGCSQNVPDKEVMRGTLADFQRTPSQIAIQLNNNVIILPMGGNTHYYQPEGVNLILGYNYVLYYGHYNNFFYDPTYFLLEDKTQP